MTGISASTSTPSGIEAVGALPWGSHFCHFYETGEDLTSALVPFFKSGLDNHEQCLWVTSDPIGEEDARSALRAAAPHLDTLERKGQIEIVDYRRWYERAGAMSPGEVLQAWLVREADALNAGYRGLRLTGNTSWLHRDQWEAFSEYERTVHETFQGRHIVALCSYCLSQCRGSDILDVVRNHEFAIARRGQEWEVVESAALAVAKEVLQRTNTELERRVAERTAELHRMMEALRESERRTREVLEALPAAVYTTDAAGRITYYNQAAVELSGRRPEIGTDQWCVSWRLYRPDGTPLPHDECPMATALRENRPITGVEAVAERPDGTRVPFLPYPTPLREASGALVGAVNMLVDISDRKTAETQQRVLLDELSHRVKNNLQMLAGLLKMAERETTSPEAGRVLHDVGQRVAAMAAAQRSLYNASAASRFNAAGLIEAVCTAAKQTFGDNVSVTCGRASGALSNDVAIALALILNELLTNAAKYGASPDGQVRIKVGLTGNGETYVLYVEDEGAGFELEEAHKHSSGLGLVAGLVQQLGGSFGVERVPGARCAVEFYDR